MRRSSEQLASGESQPQRTKMESAGEDARDSDGKQERRCGKRKLNRTMTSRLRPSIVAMDRAAGHE